MSDFEENTVKESLFSNESFFLDEKTEISELTEFTKIYRVSPISKKRSPFKKLKFKDFKSNPVLRGMLRALPIVFAFIPLGFVYGLMAFEAALPFWFAVGLSLVVFAGSSQYVAVGLLAAGQPFLAIISTTFIINLRHVLYSTAISKFLRTFNPFSKTIYSCLLTDEAFAVQSHVFTNELQTETEALSFMITHQMGWVLGSVLGFFLGQKVGDLKQWGFDYALAAMFISLIVIQLKNRVMIFLCVLSGALSLGLSLFGGKTLSVVFSTLITASLGMVWELTTPQSS